jgi:hypothetical protein
VYIAPEWGRGCREAAHAEVVS